LILGAIEISNRSTRLTVADVGERDSARILERVHAVSAKLKNLERLSALLMAEVEAARDLGAERIEVYAEADLRGTRLVRLLGRVTAGVGAGDIRIPAERERVAASFVAATVPGGADLQGPIGVALVGLATVGIGVGEPGDPPVWVGSRPVGAAVISEKARFSDPPRPNQIEAAITGASRKIESLSPPPIDRLMVVSNFAPVIERLCGGSITHDDARRGLDSILGQTSDDLAAWFGVEPATSRLLPGTIVGHAALADAFGVPVEPVGCDSVAGREWLERSGVAPAGGRTR